MRVVKKCEALRFPSHPDQHFSLSQCQVRTQSFITSDTASTTSFVFVLVTPMLPIKDMKEFIRSIQSVFMPQLRSPKHMKFQYFIMSFRITCSTFSLGYNITFIVLYSKQTHSVLQRERDIISIFQGCSQYKYV